MALANYVFTLILDVDGAGNSNVGKNVPIEIRNADAEAALATIYSDENGLSPISQPGATTNELGKLSFWSKRGLYQVYVNGQPSDIIPVNGYVTIETLDSELVAQKLEQLVSSAEQDVEDSIYTAAANFGFNTASVYANVSDGEANTVNGDYFWVVSSDNVYVLELWLMGASSATDTGKRTINEGGLRKDGEKVSIALPLGFSFSEGAPNIDTANETLEFFGDTVISWRGNNYSLQFPDFPAVVDLSATTSSIKKVYFNTETQQFIVKGYAGTLTASEASVSPMVTIIRLSSNGYVSSDMSCPYRVNGRLIYDSDLSGEQISVITGAGSNSYPNLDNDLEELQFPSDTIFFWRDKYKIFASGINIDLTTVLSSARKVYYSFNNDSFIVKSFSDTLDANQSRDYILLAAIRSNAATTTPPSPVMTLSCPYTIDGRLFGKLIDNPLDAMVKGVAHRGYSAVAPENTLPAYRLAKENGFSYVECDIEWTSDNVPVLLHDSTIDRTSDGTGAIGSMTLATAKTYDYGSWKSAEYAGTQIPTLAEFLALCKKLSLHPYIEIKGSITTAQAGIVASEVKKSGMINDVTFISFSISSLQAMLVEIPEARVGYVGSLSSSFITDTAGLKAAENEVFADVSAASVTQSLAEESLLADVPVEVYTVNTVSDVVPLVEKGVSGITTDLLNINEILLDSENI